ncbi:hypothetical protein FBU30_001125 [Linnemannia zychae]|nr:hypothetical protein FBU30_001125 [Linnemannia zychae]
MFCFKLWDFYCTKDEGIRLRKLMELEWSAHLEKNTYHVQVDGNLYYRATEADTVKQNSNARKEHVDQSDDFSSTAYNPTTPPLYQGDGFDNPSPFSQSEEYISGYQALASLSQEMSWIVDDVDMMEKFNTFKNTQPLSPFSLALDDIANVSSGSGFAMSLSHKERKLANNVNVKSIEQMWPSISSILVRVCKWSPSSTIYSSKYSSTATLSPSSNADPSQNNSNTSSTTTSPFPSSISQSSPSVNVKTLLIRS